MTASSPTPPALARLNVWPRRSEPRGSAAFGPRGALLVELVAPRTREFWRLVPTVRPFPDIEALPWATYNFPRPLGLLLWRLLRHSPTRRWSSEAVAARA